MVKTGFACRKFIIFLLALLCLTAAGIYVVTRPWCVANIVKSAVNALGNDFQLRDLSFKKFTIDPAGSVVIKDVRFSFVFTRQKGQEWHGQIPAVYLDNLRSLAKSSKIIVSVERADVATREVRLKNVSLEMTLLLIGAKWNVSSASMRADSFAAPGIALSSLEASFSGNDSLMVVDSWRARWAQGELKGRLTVTPRDYTIHADITQVELGEVAPGMRGRIDGNADIEVRNADNAVTALDGHFDAPQGAQIPAAFLRPILSYIPPSTQRDILEKLIAAGTDVLFDHANARLKSLRSDSLNLLIEMDSEGLNLDLVVTIDLNVEGGLKSLLERLPQLASG